MKVILNGLSDSYILNKFYTQIIKEFTPEKCYVLTNLDDATKNLLQAEVNLQISFHDYQDAITGNYSYVNWATISSLDEEIIYRMAWCETIVLKMMDRLSRDSVQ